MSDGPQTPHVSDVLAAYGQGALDEVTSARVRMHLAVCRRCRTELAAWVAIGEAAEAAVGPMPQDGRLLARVWAEVDRPALRGRGLGFLGAASTPMPHRGWRLWLASALVMVLGCVVANVAWRAVPGGLVLALVAPLVAAVGVATIDRPPMRGIDRTPAPRRTLLAQLTLVVGYDLVLALGATASLVVAHRGSGLWALVTLWLGPLFLLSALSLLLSTRLSPRAAVVGAFALWTLRIIGIAAPDWRLPAGGDVLLTELWGTNATVLALAALLLAAALVAPRWETTGAP